MSQNPQGFIIMGEPVSGKNKQQIKWNRKTRKPYITKSDAAAAWQLDAIGQLVKQRGRSPTIRGPVFVDYTAYQAIDKKDVDNMEAALFDALKKALVIEDDRFITDHAGRKRVDSARPRIEVTVTPLPVTET